MFGELGKMPPKRYYGDVAVKAARFIDQRRLLPLVHAHPNYGEHSDFKMYMNDRKPDCTAATWGHLTQAQTLTTKEVETPTDDDIMDLFHQTGIEQGLSDEDGRYSEGVLKHLATVGFRQADGSYEKILGYAAVNPLDWLEVMTCSWLFGGLYLGMALPLTANAQIMKGENWSYKSSGSESAPGSWGGHAVYMFAAQARSGKVATWGQHQGLTPKWFHTYVDEAYAVVTADWVRKTAPSGFDRDSLVGMLQEING